MHVQPTVVFYILKVYEFFFFGKRSETFALRKIYSTNLANLPSRNRPEDCSSYVEWTEMRPECWSGWAGQFDRASF